MLTYLKIYKCALLRVHIYSFFSDLLLCNNYQSNKTGKKPDPVEQWSVRSDQKGLGPSLLFKMATSGSFTVRRDSVRFFCLHWCRLFLMTLCLLISNGNETEKRRKGKVGRFRGTSGHEAIGRTEVRGGRERMLRHILVQRMSSGDYDNLTIENVRKSPREVLSGPRGLLRDSGIRQGDLPAPRSTQSKTKMLPLLVFFHQSPRLPA